MCESIHINSKKPLNFKEITEKQENVYNVHLQLRNLQQDLKMILKYWENFPSPSIVSEFWY